MITVPEIEDAVLQSYRRRTPRSQALHETAKRYLPGGDSRAATFFLPYPVYMERGAGCHLYDVDANDYLDLLGNFTSIIHGHAPPAVVEAITRQAERGTAHGAPTEELLKLAAILVERVQSLDRVRFVNSGSEAVMNALRAARAVTGRSKILKMEGGYHGSYDAAEISVTPAAGPPAWPRGQEAGPGLSPGLTGEVLIAPFNDLETTTAILQEHVAELAAVIVEPIQGAAGMIAADPAFLQGLRQVTRELQVLLILDEVISFRLATGGAQQVYGVEPDLTTFGKIIGGGLPVGAFGGCDEVMAVFDPHREGGIHHSGTFNGNAATMAAGVASMELLDAAAIQRINTLGEQLRRGLEELSERAGIAATVTGDGSLAHLHLTAPPVRDCRAAAGSDSRIEKLMHIALLNRGVFTASRLSMVISTAMGLSDVETVLEAFEAALDEVMSAPVDAIVSGDG